MPSVPDCVASADRSRSPAVSASAPSVGAPGGPEAVCRAPHDHSCPAIRGPAHPAPPGRGARTGERASPARLGALGTGPITAAQILVSWSPPGRFRSEAALASFAGVAPIRPRRA
ncbi:transposase [Streptomyces sp. NWU49]|uniref:transposase n=1 Tax=Streptomyces sp. NWU49 TaxID=2201153 RepID=UPI0035C17258